MKRYDQLIKRYARQYDFNWKLIKMQVLVESGGDPYTVSSVGARGLMQITSQVWERFGSGSIFNPADNIQAGCRYLNWLYNKFSEVSDEKERFKFALAAYNAGCQNIKKLIARAKKAGYTAPDWETACRFLPQITGEKARETIGYVNKVMNGYYLEEE